MCRFSNVISTCISQYRYLKQHAAALRAHRIEFTLISHCRLLCWKWETWDGFYFITIANDLYSASSELKISTRVIDPFKIMIQCFHCCRILLLKFRAKTSLIGQEFIWWVYIMLTLVEELFTIFYDPIVFVFHFNFVSSRKNNDTKSLFSTFLVLIFVLRAWILRQIRRKWQELPLLTWLLTCEIRKSIWIN